MHAIEFTPQEGIVLISALQAYRRTAEKNAEQFASRGEPDLGRAYSVIVRNTEALLKKVSAS